MARQTVGLETTLGCSFVRTTQAPVEGSKVSRQTSGGGRGCASARGGVRRLVEACGVVRGRAEAYEGARKVRGCAGASRGVEGRAGVCALEASAGKAKATILDRGH